MSAIAEIKELLSKTETDEGSETSAEKLDVILSKMEENSLLLAQNKKIESEEVQIEAKFSVDAYDTIRNWSKKWN